MIRFIHYVVLSVICSVSLIGRAQSWTDDMYALYTYANYTNFAPFNQSIESTDYSNDLLEAAVFYETNRQRVIHGLSPLEYEYNLRVSAHNHSVTMVEHEFFSHESPLPGMTSPRDRIEATGLNPQTTGENIALRSIEYTYSETAKELLKQWMNSSGHRANILDKDFTQLGCGVAFYVGDYNVIYIKATQNFMRPWEDYQAVINSSTQTLSNQQSQSRRIPETQFAVELTPSEQELYELIMQYRQEKNLPRISLSPSLTYVAQIHARDVYQYYNEIPSGCNYHSWSGHGPWTKCDYYPDHRNKSGMWSKPRELTGYTGYGFEIAHFYKPPTSGICTPLGALNGWKGSPGHNAVIINLGKWSDKTWRAIGIGMYKGVACVWFGCEEDKASFSSSPALSQGTPATQSKASSAQNVAVQESPQHTTTSSSVFNPVIQSTFSKPNQSEQKEQSQKKRPTLLSRYFDYSGRKILSYLSMGYTYSCMSNAHMVNASLLDFRVTLFGASLLNAEMSVSPFNKRFAYIPMIRLYIPVAKCFSIVPYGGAEIDASYVAKYIDKNYSYDVDKDFYVNVVGGLAFNLTIMKHVPIEIKAEYRHPALVPTAGCLNPQGVYVGSQIYFAQVFNK